ncbi:MAG: oxidoreductase membrane subunit [Eubacteriales bacterium]|nr:oxidoreductase membrane subunit [Eubacteriales bacterium]
MKRVTFKQQIFAGIILIVAGNVLALISHKGLFVNIAWLLYGLVLIFHPVYPEKYRDDEKRAKLASRISGVVCVLVGVLTRYIP